MNENTESPAERDNAQAGTPHNTPEGVSALVRTIEELRANTSTLEARMESLRENYESHLERHRERIESLRAELEEARQTDAYAERVKAEEAQRLARVAEGRAQQAENDKRRAEELAQRLRESVSGEGNLEPTDPRLRHLWEKAFRIADRAGYCSEFERIAEALGIPVDLEGDYSGEVEVYFPSFTLTIPVSGSGRISDIKNGDIDFDFDWSDIAEAFDSERPDYEIHSTDISLDD